MESLTTEIGQRLAGTEAHKRAVAWAEAKLKAGGFENVHSEPFHRPCLDPRRRKRGDRRSGEATSAHYRTWSLGRDGCQRHRQRSRSFGPMPSYWRALGIACRQDRGGDAAHGANTGRQRLWRGQSDPRAGPSEAARRGAVAYLLRSLGTDSHRLPHTGALNYDDGTSRISAAALANPDADQLERLAALGPVRVRLLLTPTVYENAPSWNVVGEVKGAERPDEIVLIGGHLDSWDLGTGATDDGAGIAIAFGAARLIAGLPKRPSRTIRIVLFGAEEMDFSGAAYAKAHEGEIGKIVVASEADFGARTVYSVQLPLGAADSDFGLTLARIIARLGANVDRRPALSSGEDIRELQKAGVPVVSLRQDGLDYFDAHHTADDTLDKIDPKQLNQAVAVWSVFTYLAAASDVDFRSLTATAK